MSKQWYILQTRSNAEKKAQKQLTERIGNSDIANHFGQVLVPEEIVIETKNGERKETTRKLYTGYIFVEMEFSDDAWHIIKGTPNILGFVSGSPQRPVPMKNAEIANILQQVEASKEKPVPKKAFEPGQVLTIKDGPFKDFDATVSSVNYNSQELKVSVLIFGRETQVDVMFDHVIPK